MGVSILGTGGGWRYVRPVSFTFFRFATSPVSPNPLIGFENKAISFEAVVLVLGSGSSIS